MTAREFRRFKEKNKLSAKDLSAILLQSEESIYAKLRGTRIISQRDHRMVEIYEQSKAQSK